MATGNMVITGASTGIGEALKKKASGKLPPVLLDVTSEESIGAAVRTLGDIPLDAVRVDVTKSDGRSGRPLPDGRGSESGLSGAPSRDR